MLLKVLKFSKRKIKTIKPSVDNSKFQELEAAFP